jgi:hypothetical protein
MPTTYDAEVNNKPLGWGTRKRRSKPSADGTPGELRPPDKDTDVDDFARILRSRREHIFSCLAKCGEELGPRDRIDFMEQLRTILIEFVAACRARPLRTPMKLMPTVKLIRDDPESFLENVANYAPAAADLVYAAYRKLFPERQDLEAFEAGLGPPPPAADIARAADAAIAVLEQAAKARGRGRPPIDLVKNLSVTLGNLFVCFDGHLRRTVHDEESGPFHAFLTIVTETVRPLLRDTDYTLTRETMVRFARKKHRRGKNLRPEQAPN